MSEKRYKRREAVALTYMPELNEAPKVTAKGKGQVAENILEKAREHGVPIQEDPSLVELLGQLEVNETIPDQLYQAVSEVLAYVYRLDRSKSGK